jgi:hypothetical protein
MRPGNASDCMPCLNECSVKLGGLCAAISHHCKARVWHTSSSCLALYRRFMHYVEDSYTRLIHICRWCMSMLIRLLSESSAMYECFVGVLLLHVYCRVCMHHSYIHMCRCMHSYTHMCACTYSYMHEHEHIDACQSRTHLAHSRCVHAYAATFRLPEFTPGPSLLATGKIMSPGCTCS